MPKRAGLSVTELQQQIFDREGFRVVFERLGAADTPIAAYDYPVMAPQAWKVSDWKRMRLGKYLLTFRGVTVYDGHGEPLKRDVKLGHLRDTYYAETYGTLGADDTSPEERGPANAPDNVVAMDEHRTRRSKR